MNKNNLKDKLNKNKLIDDVEETDNDNTGFVLGIISAILLLSCIGTLLVFNNIRVRRMITDKINNINLDSAKNSSQIETTNTLLTEQKLNITVGHINGTIGRLTNISFRKNHTIVKIAVTNGFWHDIHLNLHGKGVILIDDLGNKHNLKPPLDNPELQIEPNTTFQGDLVFQGGINSKANNLTLITNNQIGSDQSFTRRPKMEFFIPLFSQEDKSKKGEEEQNTNKEESEKKEEIDKKEEKSINS